MKNFYNYNLNLKTNFNNLVDLATIYLVAKKRVLLNKKLLNYKKIIIKLYTKQFKVTTNIEILEYKKIEIYKRVKKFNFSINAKILLFKLIYKVKKNFNSNI